MAHWVAAIVVIVVILLIAAGGWTIYTQLRARKLGLPAPPLLPFSRNSNQRSQNGYTAPSPAPGGVQGWLSTKFSALFNSRTAGGAYESTGYSGNTGRGRRGLDPDEAWDTRVGNEADYGGGYYEEQELGLQDPAHGPYGGGGYGAGPGAGNPGHIGVGGIEEGRGRSRSRQRVLDDRYDAEMGAGPTKARDPFADEAERSDMSLRGVSPRPVADATRGHKNQQSLGATSNEDSPTERRSMFREDM